MVEGKAKVNELVIDGSIIFPNSEKIEDYSYDLPGSGYLSLTSSSDSSVIGNLNFDNPTFMAWVYHTGANVGQIVTKHGTTTATSCWQFRLDSNGAIRFIVWNTSGALTNTPSTSTVPLNTWTHVAATFDGSNVKYYINGVEDTTTPAATGTLRQATLDVLIGKRTNNTDETFDGYIDDVALFEGALTQGNIENIYKLGRGNFDGSGYATIENLYLFDNGTADDSIGSADGTLTGDAEVINTGGTAQAIKLSNNLKIQGHLGIGTDPSLYSLTLDDMRANTIDTVTLIADKSYITTSDPDIEVLSPITPQRAANLLAYVPEEKKGISLFTDGDKLYAIKGSDYYEVPLTLVGKLPKPNVPIPETVTEYYFDKYDNEVKSMSKPIISTPYKLDETKTLDKTTGLLVDKPVKEVIEKPILEEE